MTVLTLAPRARRAISRWVDGEGDLRHMELLRIAAGPLVVAHLWGFLSDAADGITYSDRFYLPYWSWYPELPPVAYATLLWLAIPAAVLLSLGAATRYAAAYCALFVGYNLFLSRTHFGHNRAFLLVILAGLAFLPLGRSLSVDAVLRGRRDGSRQQVRGPLWPVALMRFEVVAMFLGSGLSKLIDPDWFGGLVTRLRVEQWSGNARSRGVPQWAIDLVAADGFHVVFAKLAVLTEIGIAIGLAYRLTRPAAMWAAFWFHVFIEAVASVQVFSFAAIAALVIWLTPSSERPLVIGGDSRAVRLLASIVQALDWTGRFRIIRQASAPVGVRLDESGPTGPEAVRIVLARLPVLFAFAAPLNLGGFARRWDRATAAAFGSEARDPQ